MRTIILLPLAAIATAQGSAGLAVTPACGSAARTALTTLAPAAVCTPALLQALNSTFALQSCAETNLACLQSPFALDMPPRTPASVGASLLTSPSAATCPLCALTGSTGGLSSCRSALTSLLSAIDAGTAPVAAACGSLSDRLALLELRDQSMITCLTAAPINATAGAGLMDMRSMKQCGSCAVSPCMPGMLCAANSLPRLCPAGSFCPSSGSLQACPAGYFCPEGSAFPVQCRGSASCPAQADREVVFVPILVALIFLAVIAVYTALWANGPLVDMLYTLKLVTPPQRKGNNSHSSAAVEKNAPTAADAAGVNITAETGAAAPAMGTARAAPAPRRAAVTIRFDQLSLTTAGKVRLNAVSGRVQSGRFTAIMGGSGAGKTTLMTVLLGHEKQTSGSISFIRVNAAGVEEETLSASATRRAIGYVPQQDIMMPELTVRETLLHSARMRLPPGTSLADCNARVEDAMAKLSLGKLADRVVGSADGMGGASTISSAERKRVSIATELVANPAVIFLDEPTSGLDASASLSIARMISELAATGLTCVAVIHQPRQEIFDAVDDLIALGTGGVIVFNGPAKLSSAYLERVGGFLRPSRMNPADFAIDAIAGKFGSLRNEASLPHTLSATGVGAVVSTSDSADNITKPAAEPVYAALANVWTARGDAVVAQLIAERSGATSSSVIVPTARPPTPTTSRAQQEVASSGWFAQLWAVFLRANVQHIRGASMLIDFCICFAGGVVMGIVTSGGPLFLPPLPYMYNNACPPGFASVCQWARRVMVMPSCFYVTMTLGMIVMPAAVRTFGREKAAFLREYRTGTRALPYFLGKVLADVPYVAVSAFMFIAPLVIIAPWRAPPEWLYAIMFVLGMFINSLGYALSLLLADPDAANLVGIILAIIMNLFGGFVPRLGTFGVWAYTRWSQRAIANVEMIKGFGVTVDLFNTLAAEEYRSPNVSSDLGALFLFAVVTNVLAFTLLMRSLPKV